MLKPSEIIRMAMNHPSYLQNPDDCECYPYFYLCYVIQDHFKITEEQETSTLQAIRSTLGGYNALEAYLMDTQNLYTGLKSQEYKQAAFEHWNKLIEKLEKEGN